MPTRREMLIAGAVVAGLSADPRAAAAAPVHADVPDALRRSVFAPLIGSSVDIVGDGRRRTMVLVAADGTEDAFALTFAADAPGRDTLEPGIYQVRHERFALLRLFLTPVGARPGRYEAVVDRRTA